MNLMAIGTIKSPVTEGVDQNWGDVIAEIQLDEALAAGLQGLEEFSHILVIFYMHQSQFDSSVNQARC